MEQSFKCLKAVIIPNLHAVFLLCSVSQSSVTLCAPWTVACQAPLSLELSRQEYRSGLPFPAPGDLPDPGIKPASPAQQADSLPLRHQGSPRAVFTPQMKQGIIEMAVPRLEAENVSWQPGLPRVSPPKSASLKGGASPPATLPRTSFQGCLGRRWMGIFFRRPTDT